MTPGTTPACWAAHLGLLACEESFARRAVASAKAGLKSLPRAYDRALGKEGAAPGEWRGERFLPYWTAAGDGVAVVRMDGPMAKAWGEKFGEYSTVFARRAIRAAVADESVGSILLVIDSPGGYVEGTADLAAEIVKARESKPVRAFVEDLCASAAYWIASQAEKVWANADTADIGSIGVYTVIEDSSKAAELAGVTVHLIATGDLKGAGEPGVPVTDAMLAAWQERIDGTMSVFKKAVMSGRQMDAKAFDAVSSGRTWKAPEAKRLGLIDGVRTLDEVVAGMPRSRRSRAASVALARARIDAAK